MALIGDKSDGVKRIFLRRVVAAGGDGCIDGADGADALNAFYAGKPVLRLLGLKFLAHVLEHVFAHTHLRLAAASMPNQVDGKIKKERAKRLIELSKELEIEYMNKFIGKTVEVLTENNKDGITYGHTGNFLHVKINKVLPNDLLKMVKITSVSYPYVIGELIDE